MLFGFTGRAFDETTGLQQNTHRWYEALVGGWLSEDPIGFSALDSNVKRYVSNQPIHFIDPLGLEEVEESFSRPTDDLGEYYPGTTIPYETASINVKATVTCLGSSTTDYIGVGEVPCSSTTWRYKIVLDYKATLRSAPRNGDDPAEFAANWGIEANHTGWFVDNFYPFSVTRPPGGGIVGSVVSGRAEATQSTTFTDTIGSGATSETASFSQDFFVRSVVILTDGYHDTKYTVTFDANGATITNLKLIGSSTSNRYNGPLRPGSNPYPRLP